MLKIFPEIVEFLLPVFNKSKFSGDISKNNIVLVSSISDANS